MKELDTIMNVFVKAIRDNIFYKYFRGIWLGETFMNDKFLHISIDVVFFIYFIS